MKIKIRLMLETLDYTDVLKFAEDTLVSGWVEGCEIIVEEADLLSHPQGLAVASRLDHLFNTTIDKEGILSHTMSKYGGVIKLGEKQTDEDCSNGCTVPDIHGMGYSKDKYFPCYIAITVNDLISGKLGANTLQECIDSKNEVFNELCRYCGYYNKDKK